jgi:suppressor of G2 allele of SKP1
MLPVTNTTATMSTPLEQAQALFDAEKYAECSALAQAAVDADDASKRALKMLVRKCATHTAGGDAPVSVAAAASPAAAPAPKPKAAPAVRHEWFQTATTLSFTFYVKNRTKEQVEVTVEERSLAVAITLDDSTEFQVNFEPLFGAVDASDFAVSIRAPKVEITLKKKAALQWPGLELAEGVQPAQAFTAEAQKTSYPNSKGKDWSKVKLEEGEEGEEGKASGDEGMNKFFKDIYSKATDDNKRAMMKSFQESGGTVLSTNWDDVGSRDVVGEAPNGMVQAKYEQ